MGRDSNDKITLGLITRMRVVVSTVLSRMPEGKWIAVEGRPRCETGSVRTARIVAKIAENPARHLGELMGLS
jgi:hypothetical protein